MKLCYQVATPDIKISPAVTAYQGPLETSFRSLSQLGYDGVELMTGKPSALDWREVLDLAGHFKLFTALVCTGEIYGQLGLSFCDTDAGRRREAIDQVKGIIDFAAFLGADVNIGRVRGQYNDSVPKELTEEWAIEAFRELGEYAGNKGIYLALENVTIMQTNFINTIEEACKMVDNVDRPAFRIMMDVFHMNIEEKDIYSTISRYRNYNIHVHLADNNRRYPGHCGLDFRKIIQAFHDVGYDRSFCTEIFQLPDQEMAAKGSIEYLAPIFEEVYGWTGLRK